MKYKIKKKNGFTLIELLVASSIFVIVITVAVTSFVISLKGYRRVLAQQDLQDNARYLLGFIAKEIRMSRIKISNPNNIATPILVITRSDKDDVNYSFSGGNLLRNGSIINSSNISITSGNFYITGVGLNDGQQPKVTIVMKMETIGDKLEEKTELNIQTTLCSRDIEYISL